MFVFLQNNSDANMLVSKLHIRYAQLDSFRTYTIVAENELAVKKHDVTLFRRKNTMT